MLKRAYLGNWETGQFLAKENSIPHIGKEKRFVF